MKHRIFLFTILILFTQVLLLHAHAPSTVTLNFIKKTRMLEHYNLLELEQFMSRNCSGSHRGHPGEPVGGQACQKPDLTTDLQSIITIAERGAFV